MSDKFYIGGLSFSEAVNEAEVTTQDTRFRPKKIGECKVEVYGPNEGPIPHFHIYNNDHSFECCVRIYDNHFFSHGNKYRDTLNAKQCRELNKWLTQLNDKSLVPTTNWQSIAFSWESANPECVYPESKKCKVQPHYEDMCNFRDVQ